MKAHALVSEAEAAARPGVFVARDKAKASMERLKQ